MSLQSLRSRVRLHIGRRKDALDAAVVQIGKNVTGVRGDVANLAVSAPFISLPSSTPIEIPTHL